MNRPTRADVCTSKLRGKKLQNFCVIIRLYLVCSLKENIRTAYLFQARIHHPPPPGRPAKTIHCYIFPLPAARIGRVAARAAGPAACPTAFKWRPWRPTSQPYLTDGWLTWKNSTKITGVKSILCLNFWLPTSLKAGSCRWCLRLGRRRNYRVFGLALHPRSFKQVLSSCQTCQTERLSTWRRMLGRQMYSICWGVSTIPMQCYIFFELFYFSYPITLSIGHLFAMHALSCVY